ncbi:MAG: M28 family peptidase [Thermoanaerobaculia bacterium]
MRKLIILTMLVAVPVAAQDTTPERILRRAVETSRAYETLAHLSDDIGPRLSGSRNAALAVDWTTKRFREWGIDVTNEPVMVPHWVRGRESATLVSHNDQNIVLTALGGSVATPAAGITADVIEVSSYDELKSFGSRVKGKIVFYNNPMDMELVRARRSFEAYRKAVEFRGSGASQAAQYGAAAVVIRSVGSASLRTPHTGSVKYDEKLPKIPAAAMTAEDAMLIHRLIARGGNVRMNLILTPRDLPQVRSANVIAEIRGSEKPDEIVLIGAHLDSWDLGTGAIDDGSGVAMVMDTMRIIHDFGTGFSLRPKRTIRCVLFMNEENGLNGGKTYFADHKNEKHVAAIESDAGVAAPNGFTTTLSGDAVTSLAARVSILDRIGAAKFETKEETGADTSFLVKAGVPGFGFVPDPLQYFDYHHSPADTLDKVDSLDLSKDTAAIAVLAWTLAND